MVNILFFIKRKKLLKDGTAPIYIRVTVNKVSSEFATGKSINPSQWIAVKGRVKGNTLLNKQLNTFLDQQEYALHDIALQIQQYGKPVTAKEIARKYKGKDTPQISLVSLYEDHNKMQQELVGISVAKNTYKRHETSLKLFQEFLSYEYHINDIFIYEVDIEMLEKYKHYLMTVRHNNNNTTVKYIRNLGKVLNLAVERQLIPNSPVELLHLKIDEVDKEYLTAEELDRLAKKQFAIERLEQVRDVFLFCCYSGLAYVDVHSLTESDIVKDGDRYWIRKARHKTNTMCHIPLIAPALEILNKYKMYRAATGFMLPVLSNQKMNAYLKEIADIAGIIKNLTTHAARHTFATTVTLANNVSIENVSKMLGHKTIRMTQHYARILDSSIDRDMTHVEQKYKCVCPTPLLL